MLLSDHGGAWCCYLIMGVLGAADCLRGDSCHLRHSSRCDRLHLLRLVSERSCIYLGDLLTHEGLYHAQMEAAGIPYLPSKVSRAQSLISVRLLSITVRGSQTIAGE